MQWKGFSKESLEFLAAIKENNSKEWFENHKDEYERLILNPSRAFVQEMGEHLMALEPTINFSPKINQSLFRIYRDTRRMGANKLPMKHRIGIIFWQGQGKRLQSSSFYLHFSAEELFVAVGVRWFEKPLLDAYREHIKEANNRAELAEIIKQLSAKGYKTIEKGYKRLPRGFESSMENVELALYKGMAMYATLDPILMTQEQKCIDTLYKIYEDMLPLQQYMYNVSLRVKYE